jgi:hypothetical protein
MYDFLDIVLSVVVFLSPHDVKAVQIWPHAADPNSQKRELSQTWRRDGNSLTVKLELDIRSDADEYWEKGKKTGEKHF